MSNAKTRPPNGEPAEPQAAIEAMTPVDKGMELTVRLRNPLNRAIHYIADVRGMIFDPATRRFRVQLSDRGREMARAMITMEPRFRSVDPHGEALIKIQLPKTIVKLAEVQAAGKEPVFEEYAIADAAEIELEIGWADTPYYQDPREKARGTSPISSWEQHTLRARFTPQSEKRG